MEAKDSSTRYEPSKADKTESSFAESYRNADEDNLESALTAMDRQYATQTDIHKRIHIVGTGSIGKLVAHSLRGIPNPPPITLVFHRHDLWETWQRSKRQITLQDEEFKIQRTGYEVEWAPEVNRRHGMPVDNQNPDDVYDIAAETGARPHEVVTFMREQKLESSQGTQKMVPGQSTESVQQSSTSDPFTRVRRGVSNELIHNLIVTTKTIRTIPALLSLRHRITKETTICFLQNGMGVIDDVNAQIFPREEDRPTYIQGIITHGANVPPQEAKSDPFYVVHAGHGTIALGIIPRQKPNANPSLEAAAESSSSQEFQSPQVDKWAPSARYLIRTLTRSTVLCAVGFSPMELLQQQLEKLAVNSIMNPLTVLLDARNGHLLFNFALSRTMRLMLAETSLVIRSLPELKGIPNVPHRFSAERLETLVVSVAKKTRNNISSMLADVRAGQQTEIEYINGYIVKRGEELGIKCVVNYAIMQVVIGKAHMIQRETREAVPLVISERETRSQN